MLGTLLALLVGLLIVVRIFRRPLTKYTNRLAARSRMKSRGRLDRFKLLGRAHVRELLLADPVIAAAVDEHVAATGHTSTAAWLSL